MPLTEEEEEERRVQDREEIQELHVEEQEQQHEEQVVEEEKQQQQQQQQQQQDLKGDHVSLRRRHTRLLSEHKICCQTPGTPSPSWKMLNSMGNPATLDSSHRADLVAGTLPGRDIISARKLGAVLWELGGQYYGRDKVPTQKQQQQQQQPQLPPPSTPQHQQRRRQQHPQQQRQPHDLRRRRQYPPCSSPPLDTISSLRSSSAAFSSHPIMSKIDATKHLKLCQSCPFIECTSPTSHDLVKVLHHLCSLEEEHRRIVSSLRSDLQRSRASVHRLLTERKLHQQGIAKLRKKLASEKSMAHIRLQEAVSLAVASLREELDNERESRQKLEAYHKKILKDMGDAKKSLMKLQKDLERERRARKLMEDVCDELAGEIVDDKAKVKDIKRRSVRLRQKCKMLEMVDVWRNEKSHVIPSSSRTSSPYRSSTVLKEFRGSCSRDNSLRTQLLHAKLEAQEMTRENKGWTS